MEYTFSVTHCHFHLKKDNTLIITGYFPFDNPNRYSLVLMADNNEVKAAVSENTSNEIRRRYIGKNQNISTEYTIEVDLSDLLGIKELSIYCRKGSEESKAFKISKKELGRLKEQYEFNVDNSVVLDGSIRLIGWSVGRGNESFFLTDAGSPVDIKVKRLYRKDVLAVFQELEADYQAGFEIEFERKAYKDLMLVIDDDEHSVDCGLDTKRVLAGGYPLKDKPFIERVKKAATEKSIIDIARLGKSKLMPKKEVSKYMTFVAANQLTADQLREQRHTKFDRNPLMSIVVPMYKTEEKYLSELVDSVIGQTYANWELILADGSPDNSLELFLQEKYCGEARIRYHKLLKNDGISENTNRAMELAKGDFIVLSDHDDTLASDALYECVKKINEFDDCDVIYSDEDKVSMEGDLYFDPSFKPDFNIDYLTSVNYVCHLFVFSREIYEKVGALNKEYDGAQDHDFILRCVEVAKRVCHVPKVLYHWRCHVDSTAMNLESKLYALDNGARAVEAHYKRLGIPASVERGEFYGTYHTSYRWKDKPLVSIIIPTKDHSEDLRKCIESIEIRSLYKNYEFVIVENNSVEPATFSYYEVLKEKKNVKLVTYEGSFNFSAINNLGAKNAAGEYYLLLNNDTEIINENCISELLGVCMREDVGICGAKLLYPDNTIQHGGIVMGIGGIAGHIFTGMDRSAPGYMYRGAVSQDLSAVTAACLMIKASVFDQVCGLTEKLEVAFNDVDLCLKARKLGYLVVYNPNALLYHYESKSRGYEDDATKQERFNKEAEKLEAFWPEVFAKCDPYYNPNLSLVDGQFQLK